MKVIGLTGLAGSGKSYISTILREDFGYTVIDSDSVTKELFVPGESLYEDYIRILGSDILSESGEIDKKKAAAKIFASDEIRKEINDCAHPATIDEIKRRIRAAQERGESLVFVESAIARSSGYDDMCDEYWFVECPEEERRRRLKEIRGYSDEKIDSIIRTQANELGLICGSDCVIVNNYKATREELKERILFDLLKP